MKADEPHTDDSKKWSKQTVSAEVVSKICYAILFISTMVTVIYALVIMWGDKTGENALKSLGTALVFVFGSLVILVANNIMVKRKWWR